MTIRAKSDGEFLAAKPPVDPAGETMAVRGPDPSSDIELLATIASGPRPGGTGGDTGGAKGAEGSQTDYPELVTVSASHYVLGQEMARGGMGRIRVARDRRLGRVVAVKEMLSSDGDANRRFEREARITARLQHPSIVNIHEAGVWSSGEPFYAMKLVDGRSLDKVIAVATTLEERLALLPTVLAVADAMAYAHEERVIHRDLKPANVLVGGFGETVVIDWGLAKDLTESAQLADDDMGRGPYRDASNDRDLTATGDVMGTPAYMPPEQANGEPVDERADVYSIGAILYHVLSGVTPYTEANSIGMLVAVLSGPPISLGRRQLSEDRTLAVRMPNAMAMRGAKVTASRRRKRTAGPKCRFVLLMRGYDAAQGTTADARCRDDARRRDQPFSSHSAATSRSSLPGSRRAAAFLVEANLALTSDAPVDSSRSAFREARRGRPSAARSSGPG